MIRESDLEAVDIAEELVDFESARLEVGRPVLYLQNEMFMLDRFELYNSDLIGDHLLITYITASGQRVELQQRWSINVENWLQVQENGKVWDEELPDGTVLHCFIDPVDSSFTATAVWRGSIFLIFADEDILPQEIIESIRIDE